ADVVLSNDSGPMHMAMALNRPTVCLFGPAHPDQYGIENESVTSFYAAVPCSPCVHEVDKPPCRGDNVCMQRILPERVEQAIRQILLNSSLDGGTQNSVRLPLVWNHPQGQAPLATLSRSRHITTATQSQDTPRE